MVPQVPETNLTVQRSSRQVLIIIRNRERRDSRPVRGERP